MAINNIWAATADFSNGDFVQNWNNSASGTLANVSLSGLNFYSSIKPHQFNKEQVLGIKYANFPFVNYTLPDYAYMYRSNENLNKSLNSNSPAFLEDNKLDSENTSDDLKISVFPNPAYNSISIKINNDKSYKYFIDNISGVTLQNGLISKSRDKIDISKLGAGMYILTLSSPDGVRVNHKIIVK